jgi:peptidoglycan/xylan/chitin deacetylase (PgdA/CDA1 family)
MGQVQIGNHTYSHLDVTRLSDRRFRTELERNEEWIQSTFGITSRPWYRPPFGRHNKHSDGIAGELGFTNILMWNGSFGDAALLTPQVLMAQAVKYLKPGTIMLGHANHPTVTHLFGQIEGIIAERQLETVTLDEMFGTSRATG